MRPEGDPLKDPGVALRRGQRDVSMRRRTEEEVPKLNKIRSVLEFEQDNSNIMEVDVPELKNKKVRQI